MSEAQRRRFARIPFTSSVRLSADALTLDCALLDISMKGMLVECPAAPALPPGTGCELVLALGEGADEAAVIHMRGEIAHAEGSRLGIAWREIDLDSITHLRRLLELNLGDAQLLDREFSALLAS